MNVLEERSGLVKFPVTRIGRRHPSGRPIDGLDCRAVIYGFISKATNVPRALVSPENAPPSVTT